jgi:hypothetical protein
MADPRKYGCVSMKRKTRNPKTKSRIRPWGDDKKRKERFLKYVFFGAMARDMENDTNEAQKIVAVASRLAEQKIPPQPRNAAKVFLHFIDGHPRSEYRWMHAFEEVA